MKEPLTKKQQEIYSYISQSMQDSNQSPTLQELKLKLQVSSLNTVVDHLKALEQKGYIIRRKHAKRNIELRNTEIDNSLTWTVNIPVVASAGCDNLSIFTDQKYDESIAVDNKLIIGRNKVFAVRAVGNSMNDANIQDGDYILAEQKEAAENNDLVVAIVGDMITVKRFERKNGLIILRPESKDSKYRPIILNENFKISGKVIYTIPGDSRDTTKIEYLPEHKNTNQHRWML